MRRFAPVLALSLALAPALLHAEDRMCEYRHPGHPGWDFFAACSVAVTEEGAATIREVTVANGSRLTTRDEGGRHSVNGLAAEKLANEAAECWRTTGENELICIHPASASAPVDAAPMPAPAALADAGFGGGQRGYCLLSQADTVIDHGACVRRENCVVLADGAGQSCLAEYDWASGRLSEVATTQTWQTLDGGAVVAGDPGCLVDAGAGLTFCYSTAEMNAATHPVLAAPAPQGDEQPQPPAAQ
ncbi:hypothetical protein [Sinisalibacter aestuarii]|uniref:Uncharacterized protein n=1 Tax=Sinisalibacter aestuarii TaxID=2949426 RepID=A0ABQ5LT94_9RHOB|nr:hypothetical protein [Sinisalibacter aestuarii]GKY88217.1 hypothetical protein STA1M1_20860 [Sinisalibacter aestuarii]